MRCVGKAFLVSPILQGEYPCFKENVCMSKQKTNKKTLVVRIVSLSLASLMVLSVILAAVMGNFY